jgi:hypothetical protein
MNRIANCQGDLTIGIVGPLDLVERVMLARAPAGQPVAAGGGAAAGFAAGGGAAAGAAGSAAAGSAAAGSAAAGSAAAGGGAAGGPAATDVPFPARRLVAAVYREEQEAPDKVLKLGRGVDACMFASQVPYSYARRAGVLCCPATFVPLGGSALFAALLRASIQTSGRGRDLGRSSIDVLSRADVEDAFAELGIPAQHVHMHEEPARPAALASFHEQLWRRDRTSAAFTCLPSVAARLSAADVPVFLLRPTGTAIRAALQAAALLGGQRRLEDAQLAITVVEVPTLRPTPRRASLRSAQEELRLTVHRFLLQEAERVQAAVSPAGDYGFVVTATRGSMAAATNGFRTLPFVQRARSELGLVIKVGIGMGRTAAEAEERARAGLGHAEPAAGARGSPPERDGHLAVPAARRAPSGIAARRPRGLETLSRLAGKLPAADSSLVVDAETAGQLLAVTPRTARRLLRVLVEEGLAWPLPPCPSPQPGRPRQSYRLAVEKLEHRAAR